MQNDSVPDLILTALKYLCIDHGDQFFFSIWNHDKCLSQLFPLHLNTYTYIVASELKDPIWHSLEWQIGSFSSEATICLRSLYKYFTLLVRGSTLDVRICMASVDVSEFRMVLVQNPLSRKWNILTTLSGRCRSCGGIPKCSQSVYKWLVTKQ